MDERSHVLVAEGGPVPMLCSGKAGGQHSSSGSQRANTPGKNSAANLAHSHLLSSLPKGEEHREG